jgi:hypothetical protein
MVSTNTSEVLLAIILRNVDSEVNGHIPQIPHKKRQRIQYNDGSEAFGVGSWDLP